MTLSSKTWKNYITALRKVSDRAEKEMLAYIRYLVDQGIEGQQQVNMMINYAYALATKYGEGAAAAACDMYDAIMLAQGANVAAAIPAKTATIQEVAKTVNGTRKTGNPEIVSQAVGRLVKLAGVDTMQQNAIEHGDEWAWIPMGDTCAFCLTLASRGWQKASKSALKNGHAEHVHANCDCTYCVRPKNSDLNVEGYEPEVYLDMYYDAEGNTPKERINALRREFYAENKETINEQKRSAYAKRTALNSSEAEEIKL